MKNKLILIPVFSILFFTQKVDAALPIAVPFGGPIVMTYECSCSGGWLVAVYDQATKLPTALTFQFGQSLLRANYNIFIPSVQTLGTYTSGGICLMASADCGGFSTEGTISPIGFPGIGTGGI